MQNLPKVEEAKGLMTEAMGWSVMRWLREKKRVRKAADEANALLDELNEAVKSRWSEELKTAYGELNQAKGASRPQAINPEIKQLLQRVSAADDEANRARIDAERTFDEAERVLSTSLARDGCRKAIRSWELYEKAIHQAETINSHK